MSSSNSFDSIRLKSLENLYTSSGTFCTDSHGNKTSFSEFLNLINTIRFNFPKKKTRIAILAEKSCMHYSAIIATVFSGNTWVPLSLDMPTERIMDILTLAAPDVLLTSHKFSPAELGRFQSLVSSVLFFEDMVGFKGSRVTGWRKIRNTDIAIIYFTSGSTGKPKGVKISFLNISAALTSISPIIGSKKLVWGDYHDLGFVISINILFTCLYCNGRIFCANDRYDQISPNKSLVKNKVSCLVTVPSTLERMRRAKHFFSVFKSLTIVASCGEPLPLDLLKEFVSRRKIKVFNFYGSTEITTWAFYHRCLYSDLKTFSNYGYAPLGEIISGNKFLISSDGLLLISGPQVTPGYIGEPEKSHLIELDGQEWFSMGDIVDVMHGKIICKGRQDNQIKLSGYRIHLMDIEAQLRKLSGVEAAICYLSNGIEKSDKSDQKITAVLFTDETFSLSYVRKKLQKFLPSYMLPRKVFCIKKISFNKNGKIDRLGIINRLNAGEID